MYDCVGKRLSSSERLTDKGKPMQNAAMTIALQSGMIDALPEEGSISAIDLARKIGAYSGLVGALLVVVLHRAARNSTNLRILSKVRIMRLLCAIRFIRELEHHKYSHTTISKMLLGSPNPVKATLEILYVLAMSAELRRSY